MAVAPTSRPVAVDAPFVSVERLTVRYGSFLALDALDLEIRPGEAIAIAGENGAGKSTLVRCIAGDLAPTSGQVLISGNRASNPAATSRDGVAVVWQDLSLCENLDVAANLLLGRERAWTLRSDARFHAEAVALLESLGIRLPDVTRGVASLSGGERQLLAVARAMRDRPRLLILDEPTARLGVNEAAQVEELTATVRTQGTAVVLVSHNVEQMFRLADRIVVLRQGRIAGDVQAKESRPDEIVALITGQQTDSSARRQLNRLHGLADRLAASDAPSSMQLILSALGAALDAARVCIHVVEGTSLRSAGGLGLSPALQDAWAELPLGPAGGPVGLAAANGRLVVDLDVRSSPLLLPWKGLFDDSWAKSSWAAPIMGADGAIGVVTIFRRSAGNPSHDELSLVRLYAGFAASVIERERLLSEVTTRNRVLETIREMLETLAGPIPLAEGIGVVLRALCQSLRAEQVGLLTHDRSLQEPWMAVVDAHGIQLEVPAAHLATAERLLNVGRRDGKARRVPGSGGGTCLAVTFEAPAGSCVLLAEWSAGSAPTHGIALMEDAANSLRLAYERHDSEQARREATALRRSQDLQRDFLSRLSHELRTPMTAIQGFASSLMQPDIAWDAESEYRFLGRISAESSRLSRLVDDLLDFSAIESQTMRLHPDWCDLTLVLDAAVACVVAPSATEITLSCEPDLPVIWADHDRLEQVFVNLLNNALRHNPAGTRVWVTAASDDAGGVAISVNDDGEGVPDTIEPPRFRPQAERGPTAGAGLGLSIAKGIVDAHGGSIEIARLERGSRFTIHLPVEENGATQDQSDDPAVFDV